jgi:8-oxo-dGTP pyrophosphatase MutT (NUDIX family)
MSAVSGERWSVFQPAKLELLPCLGQAPRFSAHRSENKQQEYLPLSNLLASLTNLDLTDRPEEAGFRSRMLTLLGSTPECFQRSCFPAHFTGSALVVDAHGARALLHHHRKLDKWLPFGGHCDGDENVLRVAQREALEESGIEGLVVASPRPFDLDIHTIPARGAEPEHGHFDVRWMLIAPENAQFRQSEESLELRWFTPEEMASLALTRGNRRLLAKWSAILARRSHAAGA